MNIHVHNGYLVIKAEDIRDGARLGIVSNILMTDRAHHTFSALTTLEIPLTYEKPKKPKKI